MQSCQSNSQFTSHPIPHWGHEANFKAELWILMGFHEKLLSHIETSKLVWSRNVPALIWTSISEIFMTMLMGQENNFKVQLWSTHCDCRRYFQENQDFFRFSKSDLFQNLKKNLLVYESSMGLRREIKTQNHDPALILQSIFLNSSWPNSCRSGLKVICFFKPGMFQNLEEKF